jgi:hypothetical protein
MLLRAQNALQTVLSPIDASSDSQTNGVDTNLPPPFRLMRWLARSMTRSNGCCIVNNILLASLHLSWLIQVRCQQSRPSLQYLNSLASRERSTSPRHSPTGHQVGKVWLKRKRLNSRGCWLKVTRLIGFVSRFFIHCLFLLSFYSELST